MLVYELALLRPTQPPLLQDAMSNANREIDQFMSRSALPGDVHKLWIDFFFFPTITASNYYLSSHIGDILQGWMVQTNVGEYLCSMRGDSQKQSMLIAPPFG
jgi:hypothetical protein